MSVPLPDLLVSVRAAVRAASALCVAVGDPERLEKLGREPVTLADYGSQAVILRTAALAFPDDRTSTHATPRAMGWLNCRC